MLGAPSMCSKPTTTVSCFPAQQLVSPLFMLAWPQPSSHRLWHKQQRAPAWSSTEPPCGITPPPSPPQRVYNFLESWGIINWLAPRATPAPAAAALPAGTQLGPTAAPGAERPRLPGRATLGGGAAALARALAAMTGGRLLQLRFPTVAEGVTAASAGGTLTMTQREGRGNRWGARPTQQQRWRVLVLAPQLNPRYNILQHDPMALSRIR